MYTKENVTIKNLASKNSIKEELGCIAFYGDRTIATDSFRLIEVEATGEKHDPVLYPAKLIQPSHLKGEFEHDQMGVTPVDAHYPEVDQVINRAFDGKPDMTTMTVDPKLLGETLIAMSKAGARYIELSLPKTPGIALVAETYITGKHPQKKVRALVMPINR